jgi:hypothetical protein
MLPLLPILLVVAAIVGSIWLSGRQQQQASANRLALADRLGFDFNLGLGEVTGNVAGRPAHFWTYSTPNGKSRVTWCAVGVWPHRTGGLAYNIQRQNFGTKVMTWFGAKEIQVGDTAFDAAWFVQTNQPEFLAAALVPEIREKIMALPALPGENGYELAEGEVRFAVRGTFADEKLVAALEARLPLLRDLADVAEVFGAGADR